MICVGYSAGREIFEGVCEQHYGSTDTHADGQEDGTRAITVD